MTYSLLWLPEVLERAGLKVAEDPGWETRGLGDMGAVLGVLCHHTAGPKLGNMPSLSLIRNGRPGLRGPLSQLGLGRDGTFYIIAAGRAQHAGPGAWLGVTEGNRHLIGIEAENTGLADDPWPAIQLDAYERGVAALLKHAGLGAERCAGHKEYAKPRGRKIDPTFDMVAFRARVAEFLGQNPPLGKLIPAVEPKPTAAGGQPRPTLRRGSSDPAVKLLQAALHQPETGTFDGPLEALVRQFQRNAKLVPDGIVGPKCWSALDARRG
ncbi:MAG TPA: N-acetylmuramoyl-L-alanine amidase [Polyangiaceae bacterium]|nr:N-acetylmuramoyl-L-alanine amidase [Polyangiaceae bacterium]